MWRIATVTLSSFLMATCLAFNPGLAVAQPIKIGQSLPLTGPLATYAKEKRDGAAAAVVAINRAGGVRGRALELITLDDGYVPERALANTRELATQRGVSALVGYLGVPTIEACLPVFDELRIPVVGLTSGASTLRSPTRRFVFPVRAPYAREAEYIVRHLRTLGIEKFALVFQDNPLGRMGAAAYREALQAQRTTPLATLALDSEGKLAAQVAATLHAAEAQAILTFSTSLPTGELLRAYKKLGARANFYGASIVGANQLIESGGFHAVGLILSQIVPTPGSGRIAIARDYVQALESAFGDKVKPSLYGLEAFIEVRVLAVGMKRANSLLPEDIVHALESLGRFDVGGYPVQYGANNREGSSFVDLSVVSATGKMRW